MGFWQKIKQALIIDDDTESSKDVNCDVKAINEWMQFCLDHDKKMVKFFNDVSIIVGEALIEYFPVLQAKRRQSVYKDEYDVVHSDDWEKEVEKFVNSVLIKRLEPLFLIPLDLHYKTLASFVEVYSAHFEEQDAVSESYKTIYGFDDFSQYSLDPFDCINEFFVTCEEYAKSHKDEPEYKKFLSLKSKQIMKSIMHGDYTIFNLRHCCLPKLFECVIQFSIDKNAKMTPCPAIWTDKANRAFGSRDNPQTYLTTKTIEYYNTTDADTNEYYSPELDTYVNNKDLDSYAFLFSTWLLDNIFLILEDIFSEDLSINKETQMMNNYSFRFGNKKRKVVEVPKTGLDYEKVITNKLKELGFNAKTTKASGDQGADVLADKGGVSFAIQCKLYSKPVGNKAVQEANAARDFYKKDYAVVVSNAGYTKSARTAANACDVILINDTQLEKLLEYV